MGAAVTKQNHTISVLMLALCVDRARTDDDRLRQAWESPSNQL
jgi:hypothetical protein